MEGRHLEGGVVVDDAEPVQLGGGVELRRSRVRIAAPHEDRGLQGVDPLRCEHVRTRVRAQAQDQARLRVKIGACKKCPKCRVYQ